MDRLTDNANAPLRARIAIKHIQLATLSIGQSSHLLDKSIDDLLKPALTALRKAQRKLAKAISELEK